MEEKATENSRTLVSLFEGTGPVTLKQSSKAVSLPLSQDNIDLINSLLEYTINHQGLGMAAIQLGEDRRIFVFERPVGTGRLQVAINPTIVRMSGKRRRIENCFSVPLPPGQGVAVRRPSKINVSYHDEHGNLIEESLSGNTAQVFLHEFCHLEGLTLLDSSKYGTCLGITTVF